MLTCRSFYCGYTDIHLGEVKVHSVVTGGQSVAKIIHAYVLPGETLTWFV